MTGRQRPSHAVASLPAVEVTPAATLRLDPAALRELARPHSAPGRALRDAWQLFGPADVAAWTDEIAALHALDAVETGLESLHQGLADVPEAGAALIALGNTSAASEADLFRLHRVLQAVATLCDALPATCLHEAPPSGQVAAWLEVLDPGARAGRFVLSPAHDPQLGVLRQQLEAALRIELAAVAAARQLIEARYQRRLNRQRELILEDTDPLLATARQDAALQFLGRGAFDHVFGLQPDPALVAHQDQVVTLRAAVEACEAAVLAQICARLAPDVHALRAAQGWLARTDLRLARVQLRRHWQGAWPTLGDGLTIDAGEVPALAAQLAREGRAVTRQSFALGAGVTLLTGPNMGGKTVALTLAGTVQWLAQACWPVPARAATFAPVARIAWLGADESSLMGGLSSFGSEMHALAAALDGTRSLLLVDELGRGTNPHEGAALADAVVAHLQDGPSQVFFATHYPGVGAQTGVRRLRIVGLGAIATQMLVARVQEVGWKAAIDAAMDYRVVPDEVGQVAHDAIRVAACFGLPPTLLQYAAARAQLSLSPVDDEG